MTKIIVSMGFSEKQANLYLVLIKLGLVSAAELAREANLPRQTVYSLLQPMVESGLIEQSVKKSVRQFYADPNQLPNLLERKAEELKKQKKIVEEELPKLLAESKRGQEFPIVQYYDGQEGLKRLFESMLDLYKKGKQKMFRGYGINFFYPGLETFLQNFVEERHQHGVETHLFVAEGPDGFGINAEPGSLGRQVKRLNLEPQQAGIYLVGSRVYLFSYQDNVGVMIENSAIARFLKDAFDDHWERVIQ